MEADWEFEVGGDAPVIEAWWPGFVDLHLNPEQVFQLVEAVELPSLGPALLEVNDGASPVWTSKCGVWTRNDPEYFDPDELDAPEGGTIHAHGCWIDLLPKTGQQWPGPAMAEAACRQWCACLRSLPLRSCRADLIVRRAFFLPDRMGLGITAYLTACGVTAIEAQAVLQQALTPFAHVLRGQSTLQ